ncbi:hypothetical protein [Tellurirhabdus rosea]|uniref:hypothetical protein n=1 Tax=Tellurirhabdus rosea TaxID=2674997 RepID=UPI00224D5F25|nr:hypothetical protein [Tellurirhabdus rosea]
MTTETDFLHACIERIARLQSGGDRHFPAGLFPSFRGNALYGYHRPDANLFFTTITLFTLQTVAEQLPEADRQTVARMNRKARQAYPLFRNRDGLDTYNFYQTKPSQHFPHGRLLHRLDHFRLPDDVDDTAMVYLTTEPTGGQLHFLAEKLKLHANGATRRIRNTYPDYRDLRAYSTWFGKNMYVEFDACVLSNLLYCLCYFKLPFNQHDLDSLAFIRSVVETGRYRREPFRCAHSYPRTPLILYHVARLLGTFAPEPLEGIRATLVRDGLSLLDENLPAMDRLLVSTALLRLGERPGPIDVQAIGSEEIRAFSFFIAGMLTAYEHPLLYRLADSSLVRMNWTCEAHALALLVEYLVLKVERNYIS